MDIVDRKNWAIRNKWVSLDKLIDVWQYDSKLSRNEILNIIKDSFRDEEYGEKSVPFNTDRGFRVNFGPLMNDKYKEHREFHEQKLLLKESLYEDRLIHGYEPHDFIIYLYDKLVYECPPKIQEIRNHEFGAKLGGIHAKSTSELEAEQVKRKEDLLELKKWEEKVGNARKIEYHKLSCGTPGFPTADFQVFLMENEDPPLAYINPIGYAAHLRQVGYEPPPILEGRVPSSAMNISDKSGLISIALKVHMHFDSKSVNKLSKFGLESKTRKNKDDKDCNSKFGLIKTWINEEKITKPGPDGIKFIGLTNQDIMAIVYMITPPNERRRTGPKSRS